MPAIRRAAVLGGTLGLFFAMVAGLELACRSFGLTPSVNDDPALWAWHRGRVYGHAPRDRVVIAGTSRVQLGLSVDEMARLLPDHRVVQLAINGSQPLAVLRDLAQDPDFNGVVICDMAEATFEPHLLESQREYVDFFHHRGSLDVRLNRWLQAQIESRLAVLSSNVHLADLFGTVFMGAAPPRPNYLTTYADRSRAADYRLLDIARHRARRLDLARQHYAKNRGLEPTPEAWLALTRIAEPWVAQIQARGGLVVYLRMPTGGERLALDESHFPKAVYWDYLAARTAATALHFADVPGMRDFDVPDTSHLDARDREAFTRQLVEALSDRRVFDR